MTEQKITIKLHVDVDRKDFDKLVEDIGKIKSGGPKRLTFKEIRSVHDSLPRGGYLKSWNLIDFAEKLQDAYENKQRIHLNGLQ